MMDIEKVKIIVQENMWKMLMLSTPKALQLRENPIGCSICLVLSECEVLAFFE